MMDASNRAAEAVALLPRENPVERRLLEILAEAQKRAQQEAQRIQFEIDMERRRYGFRAPQAPCGYRAGRSAEDIHD